MQWVVLMLGIARAAVPATGATGDTAPTGDTGTMATTGVTGDTGLPIGEVDADGDNVTIAEGDCDDTDPDVNPNRPEVCEDRIDNDCDGLYDEECDYRIRMASLRGAGGCSDNTGSALLILLPLAWLRRSRGER